MFGAPCVAPGLRAVFVGCREACRVPTCLAVRRLGSLHFLSPPPLSPLHRPPPPFPGRGGEGGLGGLTSYRIALSSQMAATLDFLGQAFLGPKEVYEHKGTFSGNGTRRFFGGSRPQDHRPPDCINKRVTEIL